MKRKILCILLSMTMLFTCGNYAVSAKKIHETKKKNEVNHNHYKYDSLEELHKRVNEMCEDNEVSMPEHYDVNANTPQNIKEQYIAKEMQRISNMDLDFSISTGDSEKTMDLGNGTKITIN